nr:hypothetical protein Iba_chr09eCG1650 [Ipomoea batatas]
MTVKVGISSLNFQFTTSSILSEITLFGTLNCLQHVNEFPTAISSHSIVLAAFVDYGNWEAIGKGSCFLNPISTLRLRNLDGIEIFLVVSKEKQDDHRAIETWIDMIVDAVFGDEECAGA